MLRLIRRSRTFYGILTIFAASIFCRRGCPSLKMGKQGGDLSAPSTVDSSLRRPNRLPSLRNASISDLSRALEGRATSSVELTKAYIALISGVNEHFRAVIQVNPDAFSIAKELDEEQDAKGRRG